MNRIYFILFIIYLIFILIMIRVRKIRLRKIKRRNKAIAIASITCDYSTFFIGIGWGLASFPYFMLFKKYFKEVNQLLVPKYVSGWNKWFFHYEDLISLKNMFWKNKMYSEYMTVDRNGSYYFYMGMAQVLVGIIWLIVSFDKTIICEDRIYFKNKYCKWESIESYVWIELKRKQSRKKYLEYYYLQFEIETATLKRMIKYKIKIKANDKEKVEELLKEKTKINVK